MPTGVVGKYSITETVAPFCIIAFRKTTDDLAKYTVHSLDLISFW